ncbi:MAG: D-arabinose 1-dehydrogenase-like Zn-dependent alcohol dehydrogenase [Burkholderiaceae bacterium]|jgi:D-arabinose 1-dehydrogenase-like Zn-dependent alcohol dehydrogenase
MSQYQLRPTLPFIPGHEGIGIVMVRGAGVQALRALPGRLGVGLRRCPIRWLDQERRLCRIHPG